MSQRTITAEDYGCWIDGHEGQYAPIILVEIAMEFGFDPGSYDVNNIDDVMYVSEEAEDYLNENVAPDGYSFGWFDGEFFLWSFAMWDNEE